jgi:hypothetical protein
VHCQHNDGDARTSMQIRTISVNLSRKHTREWLLL